MEALTTLADWETFFAAQVGASAALAGLVFVGVSLNLQKILSAAFLPMRALLALGLLVGVLVVASLLLMPGVSILVAAVEALVVGGLVWAGGSVIEVRGWRYAADGGSRTAYVANALLLQVATIPYLVGGAILFAGRPGGLYWLAAAIILSIVKAVVDAWVLLVEINR